MKATYILLVLLTVALVSGCVDKKEQNLSSTSTNLSSTPQNISNTSTGEILNESYLSEVEDKLKQIDSMLNEKEETFSTEASDSAFED